jgi:hypothetical protein
VKDFGLIGAETAEVRMNALGRFIEYWLGPSQKNNSEPTDKVSDLTLPMPLRRLYHFLGAVPAFCQQDFLYPREMLKIADDGKLIFLQENQAVWDCRTLSFGEDPPVWSLGDQIDDDGNCLRGERQVSNSLSSFLVTYVLQELSMGAPMCLADRAIDKLFESEREVATPLWLDGQYASNRRSSFFFWNDILVSNSGSDSLRYFSARTEHAVLFLTNNQSPISDMNIRVGVPRSIDAESMGTWDLKVHFDGSALLELRDEANLHKATVPPGTFEFATCRDLVIDKCIEKGDYKRDPFAVFFRNGQ